MVVTVG